MLSLFHGIERNKKSEITTVASDLHNMSREMSDLREIAGSTSGANKLREKSRNLSRDVTRINRRRPLSVGVLLVDAIKTARFLVKKIFF